MLYFSQDDAVRCVGYIEKDGLCGWPEKVCGQRPNGWTELTSLLQTDGESAAA